MLRLGFPSMEVRAVVQLTLRSLFSEASCPVNAYLPNVEPFCPARLGAPESEVPCLHSLN